MIYQVVFPSYDSSPTLHCSSGLLVFSTNSNLYERSHCFYLYFFFCWNELSFFPVYVLLNDNFSDFEGAMIPLAYDFFFRGTWIFYRDRLINFQFLRWWQMKTITFAFVLIGCCIFIFDLFPKSFGFRWIYASVLRIDGLYQGMICILNVFILFVWPVERERNWNWNRKRMKVGSLSHAWFVI